MNTTIPGLNVEMLADSKVIAYTLTSAQRQTISSWSDLALNKLKEWPINLPYLAIHDLSLPGVGLLYLTAVEFDPFNVGVTPGGRLVFQEYLATRPAFPIRLALIVSTSMSGRLARLRISESTATKLKIESRAFFKRDTALNWLLQLVTPPVVDKVSHKQDLKD